MLVVDESEAALELLGDALRACGASVLTARGVAQALERFQVVRVDVLVSDLNLAEGGGYALIQRIRALPDTASRFAPAVALSSLSDDATRRTALRAGFWRFLTKPVEASFLCAEIATVGHAYQQSRSGT